MDVQRVLRLWLINQLMYLLQTPCPNSDGVNEVLMIQADITNIKEVKRFEVFDRWGELMFSKSNFHQMIHNMDGMVD